MSLNNYDALSNQPERDQRRLFNRAFGPRVKETDEMEK